MSMNVGLGHRARPWDRRPAGIILGVAFALCWFGGSAADYTAQPDDTPVIQTKQGGVVGLAKETPKGKKFMAFYGIPYAKPPIGDLRFKAPEPASNWDGVFTAREEGHSCVQPVRASREVTQPLTPRVKAMAKRFAAVPSLLRGVTKMMMNLDEDCLVLNVFSPVESVPTDNLLPVLVFIHGGAFLSGSSSSSMYGPEFLMDKGVILVSMNYRLGPLGFLATNTSDAPGNAGLKDQRLALRWVRDNIKAFGGDPDKVTIYGESAGSFSVHLHILSPSSKGLFRAAILSSSMATNFYGFQDDPVSESIKLAEDVGADEATRQDPVKRIEFLRNVPAKRMLDKLLLRQMKETIARRTFSTLPFVPVAEPADTEDAFLTRHPVDILLEGNYNHVPIMIGFNDAEGLLVRHLFTDEALKIIADNPSSIVPGPIQEKLESGRVPEVANKILAFYLKGQPIGPETVTQLAEAGGDVCLVHGIQVASRWHIKKATAEAPVFLYYFTLDAYRPISFLVGVDDSVKGVGHADELSFVFKMHMMEDLKPPDEARYSKGLERMLDLITNFVKSGNPTPAKTDVVDVEWPAATPERKCYLDIGDELVVKDGLPAPERMAFWDETYKAELKDPQYQGL